MKTQWTKKRKFPGKNVCVIWLVLAMFFNMSWILMAQTFGQERSNFTANNCRLEKITGAVNLGVLSAGSEPVSVLYQAESAILHHAVVENKWAGYTGKGYVNFADKRGSYLQFIVIAANRGTYTATFRFANAGMSRPMAIAVNNVVANTITFGDTAAWTAWDTQSMNLDLKAGVNIIRATSTTSAGGPNLDSVSLAGSILSCTPTLTPTMTPFPTSSPTGTITSNVGQVSFVETPVVNVGDTFTTTVQVNTGTKKLAAYAFDISFDADLLAVDTSYGQKGVAAETTGFLSAVNVNNITGRLRISGFDVSGKGPAASLKLLNIKWLSKAAGTVRLTNDVCVLCDKTLHTIGTPLGQGVEIVINSMPTPTPTSTPTPIPTTTVIPIPTQTVAPTLTPTPLQTPTPTSTPTSTPTGIPTLTPTIIPTFTSTPIVTSTPTSTRTPTPIWTPSVSVPPCSFQKLLGGDSSVLYSRSRFINNAGVVLGQSVTITGVAHAFSWKSGATTDLGTLGGRYSDAVCINKNGQIVGKSETVAGETHAFLWQDGVMTDLGTLGGSYSAAAYINSLGQIVGESSTATGETRAFLWDNGVMADLGVLSGNYTTALCINDNGQIMGNYLPGNSGTHPFIWENGIMKDLDTIGSDYLEACSMNNRGQIVGKFATPTVYENGYPVSGGSLHGFLWENGVMKDLGTLGAEYSEAYCINDNGQIVGRSDNNSHLMHGFLWENGVMKDLGTLGGEYSEALYINNSGQIFGQFLVYGESHAFEWENDVMKDLGALGGTLVTPYGINEAGQAIGYASVEGTDGAVLWNLLSSAPVITPSPTLIPTATPNPYSKILLLSKSATGSKAVYINASGQAVGELQFSYYYYHAALWKDGTETDLGTLGGSNSTAVCINDNGQIVGESDSMTGGTHAFIWEKGVMKDLGALGGYNSRAVHINNHGQVAGVADTAAGTRHAFIWENGVMTDLGDLGGGYSDVTYINENGQVIGYSNTALGEFHGFVWDNGVMTDLGTLGGYRCNPLFINNMGQIVGDSDTASGDTHAFIWEKGIIKDLGTLDGNSASARFINDAGEIAGFSMTNANGGHAVLWKEGGIKDLGTLGGFAEALSITSQGLILGSSSTVYGKYYGVVWENGILKILDSQGAASCTPVQMNEAGQIVGSAFINGISIAALWNLFPAVPSGE